MESITSDKQPLLLQRIIPVLTMNHRKLVKTSRFRNPTYIGDPLNAIKIFNEKMIDEIVVLDIAASKEKREPDFDYIGQMASECFSPLAYGGGVTSVAQARRLIQSGVEKIVLNSALQDRPELVREISDAFGSSSTVVSLDVKKNMWGKEVAGYVSGKRTKNESPAVFAKKMESLGAGEIFINHIDRDGTFLGLDNQLIAEIQASVSVPVVAAGGAKSVEEIMQTLQNTRVSAIAAGSIFVFRKNNRNSIMISYPTSPLVSQWQMIS
jgi:cyclase